MSDGAAALRQYIIRDLITSDTFFFHAFFEQEQGYSISKSVNWERNPILGRSSPILSYGGSDCAQFSLNIPLFSSIEAGDGRTVNDVDAAMRFFLSLTYPDYQQGLLAPPHRCALFLGTQLWPMVVVVNSVSLNPRGPWDTVTGRAHQATATVDFLEIDTGTPKDYLDVRSKL